MDFADLGSIEEETNRKIALARFAASCSTLPSLLVCEDCGEDIPEARRVAVPGVTRCIDCQRLIEKRG